MQSVYTHGRSEDMSKYLKEDGTKYRMFEGLQPLANDLENPYWIINKNNLKDKTIVLLLRFISTMQRLLNGLISLINMVLIHIQEKTELF